MLEIVLFLLGVLLIIVSGVVAGNSLTSITYPRSEHERGKGIRDMLLSLAILFSGALASSMGIFYLAVRSVEGVGDKTAFLSLLTIGILVALLIEMAIFCAAAAITIKVPSSSEEEQAPG